MNRSAKMREDRDAKLTEANALLDANPSGLAEDDQARYDTLVSEIETANARIVELERLERLVSAGGVGFEAGDASRTIDPPADPPLPSGPFAHERREALQVVSRSTTLNDEMKDVIAGLIQDDPHDVTRSLYASLAADPAYARAFAKIGRDPANGHRAFTTEELAAWQRADTVKRALDLSATDAIIPTHLDPNVILSDDGTVSPFREIARRATGMTNVWNGVSSGGVTTEWLAEATEAADGSPAFVTPSVTAYKLSSFVPISYEAWGDALNADGALRTLFSDEFRQAEDVAFTTGNGTTRPRGLITALDANTNTEVNNITDNTFVAADVYALIEALPARFRPRARWGANLSILNDIDQFETANGSKQFPDIMSANPTLLRRPVHEFSSMDGSITAGAQEEILVVGDFSHYLIYDRLPSTVELIPNLMGTTNGRPTGQRGLFAWSRVGGNTLVDTAFRVLLAVTN